MTTRKLVTLGPGGILKPSSPPSAPKSWASVVSIDTKVTNVPKSLAKTSPKARPVNINISLKVPPQFINQVYPDILSGMLQFMDEKTYLAFTSAKKELEDISFNNGPFMAYLEKFRPSEAKTVLAQVQIYKKKVRDHDPNYLYYEIHQDLYPDEYLTEEEEWERIREQKRGREKDTLEYRSHLEDRD